MGILLVPGIVQNADADHSRDLNLIGPTEWISESNCGPNNPDCRDVVFPKDLFLTFQKHHDPADLQKIEIFIEKWECTPSNLAYSCGSEVFSRWNISQSGATCVSGMTMWGNQGDGSQGLDGPTNSVCDGTIEVARTSQGLYQINIPGVKAFSNQAEYTIKINSWNSPTSNNYGEYKISTVETSSGPPSGTVTASSLSIRQHGTKNGGDCSQVGTWVETALGPEGGTCTLSADIQITGDGVGLWLYSS